MKGEVFFDTNVLIYAFAKGDPRVDAAWKLLARGGLVGVQTLNEFVAIAVRKMRMPWEDVIEALNAIRVLCPAVVPITIEIHDMALQIVRHHGYHIYDALVVAAALGTSCSTLYSEGMHDGHVIDGLSIRNPFRDVMANWGRG